MLVIHDIQSFCRQFFSRINSGFPAEGYKSDNGKMNLSSFIEQLNTEELLMALRSYFFSSPHVVVTLFDNVST